MDVALQEVLAKAGLRVTATEFLSLVENAAQKLAPLQPDPAAYFSPDQRRVLTEVGLDLRPMAERDPEPRASAVAAQAVLHDSALTVAEAARRLRVDTSRVRHRIAAGRLIGWKDRGGWRLPAWQFTLDGVLPGIEVVLAAIPSDQPPLAVAAFMTTPQSDLLIGERWATPREWLLAGGAPSRVARLVSVLGTPA